MSDSRINPLRTLLLAYSPSQGIEEEHHAAMLAFLENTGNPLSRDTPEGHITASCLAIHPTDASMVVLWHKKIGRWLQPGGHVEDLDESVADASLRELCEETGATTTDISKFLGIVDIDVHPIPALKDQAEHLHYDVRFGFVMSTSWEPGEGSQWMPAADVIAKLDPPTARLGRKVLALQTIG
jgi:8-oxo-dGTP pyrophosphatase MutT (NUDIX family)